jgi:hypothetical protein
MMILAKLHNSITFLRWQVFRPDGFGRCQRCAVRVICPFIGRERWAAEAKVVYFVVPQKVLVIW